MANIDSDPIIEPPGIFEIDEADVVFDDHPSPPPMPPAIAAAISQVMGSIKKLHKTDKNEFAHYAYASADAFFEAVGPLMAEAGLITIAQQADYQTRSITTDRGGQRTVLVIDWDFYLIHSSGALWPMPLRRTINVDAGGPQQWGSAQTYAEKQFMRALFKVPTGDPDADAQEPFQEAVRPPQRLARSKIPVPGYGPSQPAPKVIQPRPGDLPATEPPTPPISAASGAEKPSQDHQRAEKEDPVTSFLAALTRFTTIDDLNLYFGQFRNGPGRLLTRREQDRCAAAYTQMLDTLQRHRAGKP